MSIPLQPEETPWTNAHYRCSNCKLSQCTVRDVMYRRMVLSASFVALLGTAKAKDWQADFEQIVETLCFVSGLV